MVLFEYGGSRRPLLVKRSAVCETIEQELSRFGKAIPKVLLSGNCGSSSSLLLQRWSTTWNTYVDVERPDDLENKDHVTVVQVSSQTMPTSSKEVYIIYTCIYMYVYYCLV